MDLIQKIIAQFLDKFKLANPLAFAVVVALLSGVKIFIEGNTIPMNTQVVEWTLWFIAIVLNAGTFNILNKNK